MGRRPAWWAVVAFAVFYLLSNPDGAAGVIMHLVGDLHGAGTSCHHSSASSRRSPMITVIAVVGHRV
jgi:hypothetical protein